ncbi:MAG: ABC transporter permease [Thermodesulfobacteriota bacterium]
MFLLPSLKIAWRALRVNKLRSFLTMLGIIIGIAAVIIMIAAGAGARQVIAEQVASIGSNLIMILPGSTTSGGLRAGWGSNPTLTYEDYRAVKTECPSVVQASATVRGTAPVVYSNMNWSTVIMGVTPEYFIIREWTVLEGRSLTPSDVEGAVKVCLIGQTVAEQLFGSENPVGRVIRVKKVPFLVAGLLDRKGQSPHGQDQDDVLYLPITTARRRILGTHFHNTVGNILVQARDETLLAQAQEEVTALMDQRHRIGPGRDRDFSVRNLSEIMALAEQTARVMSLLLGAVASISLVVGGIGIMNIMLVSVTERTREIGIRMAVGARPRDILLQFLTEAVLLTMFGGAIGLALGAAGASALTRLFAWPTLIPANAVVAAFVFSAAVGIFFGYYPAWKAARLNPIEALRYE